MKRLHVACLVLFLAATAVPVSLGQRPPSLDAKANSQLRLLWIACGVEDRLIEANRKLRDWLKSKEIQHVWVETPGAHTWMVWRRNLAEFTAMLFQDKTP